MKIEPMSVERIRDTMQRINWSYADHLGTESHERASLILAWAHERARANEANFKRSPNCPMESHVFGTYQWKAHHGLCWWDRSESDWLNAVLDSIGWPQEGR